MNGSHVARGSGPDFSVEAMRPHPLVDAVLKKLLDRPQWWMGVLRRHWPVLRVPFLGLTVVTRFEHVQEVLARDQVFQTPFAGRMGELVTGPKFLLAMQDGEEYKRQRAQIMDAFRFEDVKAGIADVCGDHAEAIVEKSGGRIDAVEELITRVPTLLCREYYGLEIPDPTLFGQWTLAISSHVFAWPWGKTGGDGDRRVANAQAAARGVCAAIDDAIDRAKRARDRPRSIVGRLIEMQERKAEPSDDLIRAELFGMVIGFVPTNSIASANMLEMLLLRPDMLAKAQAAARQDDDERLWRCLFETLRFKPINPGPYRECAEDYTVGEGGPGAKRIRAGAWVLACTQSAMFDERGVVEPERFDPDRARHESMVFGFGLHWCIGAFLAAAQITRTLKPLLKKRRLRRADNDAARLERIGFMPVHLRVEFEP